MMTHCNDFRCGNARRSEYTPDQCRKCWAATNLPAVAKSLGRVVSPLPTVGLTLARRVSVPVRPPCVHEGPVRESCKSCGDKESRHVRWCTHPTADRDACTRGRVSDVYQSCADCPDYEAAGTMSVRMPEPTVRHLLYHVYPRVGGDWRTPILRIRERIGLFNGRRVVAVATDMTTEPAVMVRDALSGCGVQFVEVANDPGLREVATFAKLFDRVSDLTGPEHATMYGHAKGVTRPHTSSASRWADVLADVCMGNWPKVAEQLARHPVAGPFKKVGRGWPARESLSEWHFSGSWFWFRNDALFSKDWRRIDQFWGGIEPYPSLHFSESEAGSLFHQGTVQSLNLYDIGLWKRSVEPLYAAWVRERDSAAASSSPGTAACGGLNMGCGPHPANGWLNADVVRNDLIRPDVVIDASGRLPWGDGEFGRCYMGHVLEHVPWPDVPRFLSEVRRVVRSGGAVLVVGPDTVRSIDRLMTDGDRPGAMSFLGGVLEDDIPHQDGQSDNWDGARHQWNCHAARVVRALVSAGFTDVASVDMTPETGMDWPIVDRYNKWQCVVTARCP